MRTLTLIVDEAWNGSTVKHLLRARLHMAEGLIARVKLRETGLGGLATTKTGLKMKIRIFGEDMD